MRAVVAGSTGLVGSLLIQKLLASPQFAEVISVSRRPLGIQNAKLKEILISDFAEIASHHTKLKGDIYFCCLGTTIKDAGSQENFRKIDFDAIVAFGKLAKAHEPQSFVLISSAGANSKSSIFYSRVKGETEDLLRALQFKSLVIFRPGLLLGKRIKGRPGEGFAISVFRSLSSVIPSRIGKKLATDTNQLASRMIETGLAATPGVQIVVAADI